MAATPKPMRKEQKKLSLSLKKVDKSSPVLKAQKPTKENRKDFVKFVTDVRSKKK
jgi:hypothetical protein